MKLKVVRCSPILLLFLTLFVLSACTEKDDFNGELLKKSVSLYASAPTAINIGTLIATNEDRQIVDSIHIDRAAARAYTFSPAIKSGSVLIHSIEWTPANTRITLSPETSQLRLVENKQVCNDSFAKGLFMALLGSMKCSDTSNSTSYTSLVGSQSYPIENWDQVPHSASLSSTSTISFAGVPLTELARFQINGPDWSTDVLQAGISEEEKKNAELVKDELTRKSKKLSFRALTFLLNENYANPLIAQIVSTELKSRLNAAQSLEAFSVVLDTVDQSVARSTPAVKDIGIGFLKTMYSTSIRPSNKSAMIASFLEKDGQDLPEKEFESAFSDGVAIEKKKISEIVNRIGSTNFFNKFFTRVINGESEDDRNEKFFRTYYTSIISARQSGKNMESLMMYKALLESPDSSTSGAAFELKRDQEFRDFLKTEFEALAKAQREHADKIVSVIRQTNSEIRSVLENVEKNTQVAEESRELERERNFRMAVDMHYATKNLSN